MLWKTQIWYLLLFIPSISNTRWRAYEPIDIPTHQSHQFSRTTEEYEHYRQDTGKTRPWASKILNLRLTHVCWWYNDMWQGWLEYLLIHHGKGCPSVYLWMGSIESSHPLRKLLKHTTHKGMFEDNFIYIHFYTHTIWNDITKIYIFNNI